MNFSLMFEAASVSAVVTLACVAALLAVLWKKFKTERAKYENALIEQAEQLQTLRKELESHAGRLAEAEERYMAGGTEKSSFPASVHLNRRGQVVQLHRRGENARSIASTLGMSQGEVKLMIKLHEINGTATPQKS